MAEENLAKKSYWNTFKNWIVGKKEIKNVIPVGSITEESRGELNKALETRFFFKPPFGFPRNVDLLEIRRLAATPYVEMCLSTIIDGISAVPWGIIPTNLTEEILPEKQKNLEHIKAFFDNPNTNKESFEKILRKLVRDILEVDSGVIVKQFNLKEELVGIVAKDGATFTKNPDIFGMFTDRDDLILDTQIVGDNRQIDNMISGMIRATDARTRTAYFQFGWSPGIKPIPFGKKEVVWFERNPRTDTFYGRSPIEILANAIQMLIYTIEHNLQYYNDNNMPKGVLGLEDSDAESVKAFEEMWNEKMREQDIAGNWKRRFHHIPIINKKPTFTRIQFSNAELELLEQQRWFSKMVWASFGVTPTELGYTEDAKGLANQIIQSQIFRKRAINPLLRLIEYNVNKEIISEFEYEGIEFKFLTFDIEEEMNKIKLFEKQIDAGVRTVNEIRKSEGLDEVEWGNKPPKEFRPSTGTTFNMNELMQEKVLKKDIELKPFAGYRNFQDCVNKNQDKKDPEAYCAKIMRRIEEKKALTTTSPLFPKEGERLQKHIKKLMRQNEKKIIELLEKEKGKNQIRNIKSVQEVIKLLRSELEFGGIKSISDSVIENIFIGGWEKSERSLERNIELNKDVIEFLKNYTFGNIKGITEGIANDLRQELERGFINAESIPKLKNRVKKVFDVGENRAEMIARTETNRAENQGQLQAMKKSGVEMTKTWLATIDNRTSAICKRLDDQTVKLNEKFKDPRTKEEFDAPPAHVDCRSTIIFNVEE